MTEHDLAVYTKGLVSGVLLSWLMLVVVTGLHCAQKGGC